MTPRTRLRRSLATSAVLLGLTSALAACGGDEPSDDAGASASASADSSGDGRSGTIEAAGDGCGYYETGDAARDVELPPAEPTVSGSVTAVLSTNYGDLTLTLDADGKPCTVGSFVSLAEQGFYDETPCPRVTTYDTFGVLQCGDPTGLTSGGPGYLIPDEIDGTETYERGVVAMANADSANTGGSQFFLVYTDSDLAPDYTVFGTIDDAGLAVLDEIGEAGVEGGAQDGAPAQAVDIESVTIG
ncbi:peptidylprolyl isomerase [Nocardioides bruguierae]|uniref:peptidylprolyl isomerase n=1 Tax=Nocardioides bruguierae TaxID=2945102 RepID=UPI002021912B|nr:peptidylprolyl isomerase [Nocardioides bruguierae]MCL8025939.1 peptidylprolyl isomerase [Nocardioides bruguierae]